MTHHSTQLATLKEKVQREPKFAAAVDYYQEQVATPAFFERGSDVTDAASLELILGAAAQVLKLPVAHVTTRMIKRLPEHHFVHGVFQMGAHVCLVLYFEDIQQGILASGDERGPSQFARLSFVPRGAPGGLH